MRNCGATYQNILIDACVSTFEASKPTVLIAQSSSQMGRVTDELKVESPKLMSYLTYSNVIRILCIVDPIDRAISLSIPWFEITMTIGWTKGRQRRQQKAAGYISILAQTIIHQ